MLERFHQRREDYFGIPSLEGQDSVFNLVSPARFVVHVPDAGANDDVCSAVRNFDDYWDLEGADSVDEVDKGDVKRCLRQPQDSCCTKQRRVPANVLELFTLAKELDENLVANAPEAVRGDAEVTMADALKKAPEAADKAKVELSDLTKAQVEMRKSYTKEVDWLIEECVEELVASRASAPESHTALGSERDELMSRVSLMAA